MKYGAVESINEFGYLEEIIDDIEVFGGELDTMMDAEATRIANETTRISQENTRKSQETSRVTAESGRSSAESTRVSQETARVNAEGDATKGRVKAENLRVTAESGRVSAENTRVSQENTRKSQETARVNAESTRASNEATRQSQEATRQTNTATALTNMDNAVTSTMVVWKTAVANFASIATTYPNPQIGWRVEVNDTKKAYRYDGTTWVNIADSALVFTPENSANKGQPSGYAPLDANSKVPSANLPPLNYIPTSEKGAVSGVATLGTDGKVPSAQLPPLDYAASSHTHTIANITGLQTALDGKVDDSQVLTNVPSGAVFTDTIYTHPSSHPATMITEDTTHRFVTDTEKSTWSNKASKATTLAGYGITDGVTYSEHLSLSNLVQESYSPIGHTHNYLSTPQLIPSGANIDDYTSAGMYYCPSDATVATLLNCPTNGNAFSLLVEQHAGTKQTITRYSSNDISTWVRNKYGSTWGSWRLVWGSSGEPPTHVHDYVPMSRTINGISLSSNISIKESDIGTVYGYTANGHYKKFEDGTLICWDTKTFSTTVTQAWGSLFYHPTQSWTFPVAFVGDKPTCTATCTDSGAELIGVVPNSTLTNITFYGLRPASVATSVNLTYKLLAIGRWKA